MKRRKRDKRIDAGPKEPKRSKKEQTNVHHRKTRWTGGRDIPGNRSVVPVREHQAYNLMFNDGHMSVPEIARKLNTVWIDPEWQLIAKKKGEQAQEQCKHDCDQCENYKLRQLINPILKDMAKELVVRAFA